MANAIMLQSQNGFVWTSDIINAIKKICGENLKAVELDEAAIEAIWDLQDAKRGETAYKEFLQSGGKGISAGKVFKELGLE